MGDFVLQESQDPVDLAMGDLPLVDPIAHRLGTDLQEFRDLFDCEEFAINSHGSPPLLKQESDAPNDSW